MTWRRSWWVGVAALWGSCGVPGTLDSGQTGSPGPLECIVDADCQRVTTQWLQAFEVPQDDSLTFSSARCEIVSFVGGADSPSGPTCVCEAADSDGSERWVGPVGVDCLLEGRNGECVWEGSEFDGCEVGTDETGCEEACVELASRYAKARGATYTTSLRHAACVGDGYCESVASVGDRCYVNRELVQMDCDAPLAELLEEHETKQAPPVSTCDSGDEGEETGVCVER